jgi:hypothetical protein
MLQKFTPLASLVKANACQFLQQSLAGHSKLRASLKPKFFSYMNNQRACKKQFFTKIWVRVQCCGCMKELAMGNELLSRLATFNQSRFLLNMKDWQNFNQVLPVPNPTKDYQSTQNEHELFQSAANHQAQWPNRRFGRHKSGNTEHDGHAKWRPILGVL